MPQLPGFVSVTKSYRKVLINTEGLRRGGDVPVGSSVVDAGNGLARTTLIRAGTVVVKKTADGNYYLATDAANGDRNGPASTSSIGTGDASWNSAVVTVLMNGGVAITVTLGGATATAAAAVTDLNGNAVFAANLIADVNSTFVRIRTKKGGACEHIATSCSASTFYGAGVTLTGVGTDADYRVLSPEGEVLDMLDPTGVAAVTACPSAISGNFVLANLVNTTGEALAVLARRGSFLG